MKEIGFEGAKLLKIWQLPCICSTKLFIILKQAVFKSYHWCKTKATCCCYC